MVFPTRSYSESDDSVQYVAEMSRHKRDLHIPLPPPPGAPQLETPASFGDPVDVNIVSRRPSWIMTEAREIMMGHKGWFKSFSPPIILPKAELDRLYAHAFRMFIQSPSRVTELDEEPKPEPPFGQKPALQHRHRASSSQILPLEKRL
jgi:hypothetical protein